MAFKPTISNEEIPYVRTCDLRLLRLFYTFKLFDENNYGPKKVQNYVLR